MGRQCEGCESSGILAAVRCDLGVADIVPKIAHDSGCRVPRDNVHLKPLAPAHGLLGAIITVGTRLPRSMVYIKAARSSPDSLTSIMGRQGECCPAYVIP